MVAGRESHYTLYGYAHEIVFIPTYYDEFINWRGYAYMMRMEPGCGASR